MTTLLESGSAGESPAGATSGASKNSCRLCGSVRLRTFLDLGATPPCERFLTTEQLDEPEPTYPLHVRVCEDCLLAQLPPLITPEDTFTEYAYFSSFSSSWVAHAERFVDDAVRRQHLGSDSFVVEVASNDGYLLQHYVAEGIPVLGIDPARNVVQAAEARGVPTLCGFFEAELAEELRASGRRAAVLHANNVLAHVPDLNGFLRGIARVLDEGGVAVIETPYVRALVEHLEFDTIYHEHLFYYSLSSLDRVFRRNGLGVVGVERIPIHGGSLRVLAAAGLAQPGPSAQALLAEERRLGIGTAEYFRGFATRVERLRHRLAELLGELKAQGRRIAAYGAAAKGAVLLNACGIGRETIEFVADRSTHKQGRYMPGVHLPIVAPERLLEEMPDDVLLLTWNFAEEILSQQAEYRRRGGRFIIPIPEPVMVGQG